MSNSPSEIDWYWAKKGSDDRKGPVDWNRLKELANQGDLDQEDLVWNKEMDDWLEAGSVEDLFKDPPPLPDESQESTSEAPPPVPDTSSSERTSSDNHNQGDNRKWYDKKRFLIPMSLSFYLSPIGIYKLYCKIKERESIWYKNKKVVILQSISFFPVGWYGLYKNNDIRKIYKTIVGIIGPVFLVIMASTAPNKPKSDTQTSENNESSGPDISYVDSVKGKTAYMSTVFSSNPKNYGSDGFGGYTAQSEVNSIGRELYYAAKDIKNSEKDINNIKFKFIQSECKSYNGNVSENVPSGSFTFDNFESVLKSEGATTYSQSKAWKFQAVTVIRKGYVECSGSFDQSY